MGRHFVLSGDILARYNDRHVRSNWIRHYLRNSSRFYGDPHFG